MAASLNKYGLREPAHWRILFPSAPRQHGGRLRPGDAPSRFSVIAGGCRFLFSKFFPPSLGWSPQGKQRGKGRGDSGGQRTSSSGKNMAESARQQPSDSLEETPPTTHNFMIPKKEINTVPDMGKWKRSQAYADYIGFILTLNEGVKGKKLTCEYKVSEPINKLVALLNTLDRWIDETPPMDQPSRFGNKAFRTWYAKLDQEAENLVATVVPSHLAAAVPEVALYLKESVGNPTRIDYGTEHPHLEPRHFVDEKAVNENHKDYMFLECILFITEMKTGPFAEHSNQLWNISAVPSWSKVNQGLIRMYKAECLEKFPVIQHFKFGSLLPIQPVTSS
ncbi:serine/threonine-protein phosphatase 2A activator isoform X2 [Notamacropus eugenii]|uniref:serine/threonine-protein phosphatase 2A activator isoform X2 n=1 Tax=Notamacropus eugenii TaxID=9315 RepID=UPI003B66E28D